VKKNANKITITNEIEKAQMNGTGELCQEKPFTHSGIKFPRKLIDEAKAVFMPIFKKEELTDEECAIALTKIARLEILLRTLKAKQKNKG